MAQLGVIEGFYGKPWGFRTREELAPLLRELGYSSYIYAPKADPYFRKKWREAFPEELRNSLSKLVQDLKTANITAGVGLSLYEAYLDYDSIKRNDLRIKLESIQRLGFTEIQVLFDDMKAGIPKLAETQVQILGDVKTFAPNVRLAFCPTYYSLDPILDTISGPRPPTYLSDLGRLLPKDVSIYWTGEKICSDSYSDEHVRAIGTTLNRPPLLWDNYPVNDGPKMCHHLHLSPVQSRTPPELLLSGHRVNPMNQAWLSLIPLATLADAYQEGRYYDPVKSFRKASLQLFGTQFSEYIEEDLNLLHHQGLNQISTENRNALKHRYLSITTKNKFTDNAISELIDWLDGKYTVTREVFFT